jgi:hypothetical protein
VVVGLENELSGKQVHLVGEHAVVVHRRIGIKSVLQPDIVVLTTMTRRGVNTAGARVQGDVLAQDDQRFPVIEGMAAALVFQRPAAVSSTRMR